MSKHLWLWAVLAAVLCGGCASNRPRGSAPSPSRPAVVLGEPRPGASPEDLVLHAMGLLGTPYRFGGSSPAAGFDCSGFVWYVFGRSAGLALPRRAEDMGRAGEPVAVHALQPGDLVFFNTLHRPFSHVGIYLGEGKFIHAPSHGGEVRIEHLHQTYWARRYDGARRLFASETPAS